MKFFMFRYRCYLCLTAIFVSLLAATGASAQTATVDFVHQVVPILKAHCVTCHSGREAEGGFSMNSRNEVIDSGMVDLDKVSASRLLELITSADPDDQMPPSDRPRLAATEIDVLSNWIAAGLPWDAVFSFAENYYEPPLRPRHVELPPILSGREHPIDRILDNYLTDQQIDIPAVVDDETFLRRTKLDLIGLLPTTDEVESFRADTSPNKRIELIEHLLARNVDYADHWLTFFNDLLRNDYSGTGFITGGRKQISQWLYEALLTNKRFDQMARELVAPPTDASRGYIDGIQWRGNTSAGQTIAIQFSQSISQSFLGINMKCASCHDSFIDRWTLKDAYGLGAIYSEAPLQLHRCDKPTGQQQTAAWLFPELGQVDPAAPRDVRLQQLSELMTHPENGRFARTIVNRLWHRLMGRGLVHPLDAMQTEPWNADLLDYLACELVDNDYDLKAILRLIASSEAYQSVSASNSPAETSNDYVYSGPLPRRMTAEQFMDAVWQLTGAAPNNIAAPIFRFDSSLVDVDSIDLSGQWIWGTLTNNQAPAGESLLIRKSIHLPENVASGGAVMTCDNEFVLFIGNREIASGSDWTQLQSLVLRDLLKKGDNTLVFRVSNGGAVGSMGPAGLFFEARLELTDGSSLTIASDDSWEFHREVAETREGRLSAPQEGWNRVSVAQTHPAWKQMLDRDGRYKLAVAGLQTDRTPMVRAALVKNTPLMQSLGRPMREQIVSMRPTTLTTLEAIDLANEQTLADAFGRGGQRWAEQEWSSTEELVESMFLSALSREPSDAERILFVEYLGAKPAAAAISDALWSVCMLPEFMFVH
jgi:hypothetical protein